MDRPSPPRINISLILDRNGIPKKTKLVYTDDDISALEGLAKSIFASGADEVLFEGFPYKKRKDISFLDKDGDPVRELVYERRSGF